MNHAPEKKRLDYIDIAKAVAIFTVIMGHAVSSDTGIKNIIYSFHMPLFFILSGMVNKYRDNYTADDFKNFLLKKFTVLYTPYIAFALIYSRFSFRNLLFILYGTRETLIYSDCLTSLWFLPVMLIASVLVETVHIVSVKFSINRYLCNFIFMILFSGIGFLMPHYQKYGNPFGLDIAFIASALMLAGHFLSTYFNSEFSRKISVSFLNLIVSSVLFAVTTGFNHTDVGYVLMANAVYGNYLWFSVTALAGSIAVIAIARLVEMIKCRKKLILYIGQNTLGIFVVHKPFVELFRKIALRAGIDSNNIVTVIINSVITLIISVVIVFALNRYVPFLFGRRSNERRIT